MKGLFIPEITAEMFRNGCLEGIEALMAEGEIYDIDYTGWIPCSERLPLVSGEFLVTLFDNDGTWVSTAQWNMTFGGRWQDIFPNDGYRDISNVIAWKTLPKPYTKGDNDEER